MHYGLLALTFLSVNLDFFFMLIFLLQKYRVRQVLAGYLLGIVILLTLSFFIGRIISLFLPEWLLGILGLLPIYMALRKDDDAAAAKSTHSPTWSVLVTYLVAGE